MDPHKKRSFASWIARAIAVTLFLSTLQPEESSLLLLARAGVFTCGSTQILLG
jgi:hypothetical protein